MLKICGDFKNDITARHVNDVVTELLVMPITEYRNDKGIDDFGVLDNKLPKLDRYVSEMLSVDDDFAEFISGWYHPDFFTPKQVREHFISLYKLLRVKRKYTPTLPGWYILHQTVSDEIEAISVFAKANKKIPNYIRPIEPEQRREFEQYLVSTGVIDNEFTVDSVMAYYEDLRMYERIFDPRAALLDEPFEKIKLLDALLNHASSPWEEDFDREDRLS